MIPRENVVAGIKVVGNSWISLMGYQGQGIRLHFALRNRGRHPLRGRVRTPVVGSPMPRAFAPVRRARCGTEQYITEHQTTVACASQLVATLFKNRFAELSCRRAATMIDSGQRDEVPRLSGYQRLLPDVEQQG